MLKDCRYIIELVRVYGLGVRLSVDIETKSGEEDMSHVVSSRIKLVMTYLYNNILIADWINMLGQLH